ncbi:piggyBac transposable element-derived protein 4-like [Ischnura elegans]|uniref:piggyBac transposable element-derived protein 4-like n=2 Tax=Ischnura elegans TaxID=197161 RepID=UPI001ED8ACAD|nr:piggyBac transposable element-derived protein 4-like [Ischnura elegans]XP_046401923.1 piggyBac transposable element-derived protein 4-like [Ischnura elegans]XP_046403629.1 piggyBac transposable element-derived protein 4-like [Ischnura elegans]XP_046408193.1 piggyBac transposable element-derived protein 4-like [Ischnura elegans]XP_046408197.1 piggyBac transposable element-derived protein 4-like [Ischnura elegans]
MADAMLRDEDILRELRREWDDSGTSDDAELSEDDPDFILNEVTSDLDSSDSSSTSDCETEAAAMNQRGLRGRRGRPRGRGGRRIMADAQDGGWSEIDHVPNINVFTGMSGMVEETGLDKTTPLADFFSYFFDDDIIKIIKEQSNLYARQILQKKRSLNQISPNSRLLKWKTVTLGDVRKFLAIILHMSISERPSLANHWSTDPVISCNFCPSVMSRDRFLSILANFHLNDNTSAKKKGEAGFDPLHKVRPMFELLRSRFQCAYQPAEDVTIDEGMCAFRGRLSFKQYMPQKPSRYGIKLYMLSESDSGYIWNFDVFCGQDNVVKDVVTRLLGNLAGKGHTLYTDRYYTSPLLAMELEGLQTGLVGTTQKNRRGMPSALRNPQLSRGEQVYRRKGNVLVLCWKDKRDVYIISTRHTSEMVTYSDRRGNQRTKPAAVVNYNKKKFGVDLSDQRMSYGVFDHRSMKWWRKLAFHMILMTVQNACVLYNQVTGKKIPMTSFMKELCSDLAITQEEPSSGPGPSGGHLTRLSGKHFLSRIPIPPEKKKAQRRCKVCSDKGTEQAGKARRKDTSFECKICHLGFCVSPCFQIYHTKKNYVT